MKPALWKFLPSSVRGTPRRVEARRRPRRNPAVTGSRAVPKFAFEVYLPAAGGPEIAAAADRARAVAAEMRAAGVEVAYVRSLFLPEDETCFHLFDGASADDVAEAGRRALLGDGLVKASIESDGRRK